MTHRLRRFLVIHNPTAGARYNRRLAAVIRQLEHEGCALDIRRTGTRAQCQQLVREFSSSPDHDAIVAAGGDGTVRAVAEVLIGTSMPLGIIPVGTGNVMAHEIGLGRDPRRIADCLMEGCLATLPAAYANGEPFFLMVGAGFDARVTRWLDAGWKQRIGKLAYAWPIVRSLMQGPDAIRVRIDDREQPAGWVVATLARHYGGAFLLAPGARLGSAGVETVLFKAPDRRALIGQLAAMAAGRISSLRDIEQVPARALEIVSDRPIPVQIDGEPLGTTPVRIETGGPALHLIVPAACLAEVDAERGEARTAA